jgi:PHD/YefM family antitoxin component YafN of YafNO toxin-antitoxin module
MVIKSSAELRNGYRKIADFCKESGEPVFLTNKGEGELVVMSVAAYSEQLQRLKIERGLLRAEAEKMAGRGRYTPARDVVQEMRGAIDRVAEEPSK